MRISDWSSDVCSSDLDVRAAVRDWRAMRAAMLADAAMRVEGEGAELLRWFEGGSMTQLGHEWRTRSGDVQDPLGISESADGQLLSPAALEAAFARSEEHTSELQSLMRIPYAVFRLTNTYSQITTTQQTNHETLL